MMRWQRALASSRVALLLACSSAAFGGATALAAGSAADELVAPPPAEISGETERDGETVARPAGRRKAASRISAAWRQIGIASWYGAEHQGKRTASGARFDMNGLTAAHRSLPLGTVLRVENLANRRAVLVRVNDRGPFLGARIVDLSRAAASRIGLREAGTGRVALSIAGAME
jgi:rare lipoprotein A